MGNLMPISASLYITYHCQLSCKHCFLTQSGMLNRYILPIDIVKKIVDDAAENKVMLMIVSGGDPFMHPDIIEILKYIKDRNILPLIGASGMNLSQRVLEAVKKLNIPCIQVSLDGSNCIQNDLIRGKGSFLSISNSIKKIQQAGIHANLALTINNKNINYLSDVISFATHKGIYRVKVDFWKPYKKYNTNGFEEINNEQIHYVLTTCKKAINDINIENWITVPGYDITSGKKIIRTSYPPITIGANGEISLGEFGRVIGDVKHDVPSNIYAKVVKEMKLKSLVDVIERYLKPINIEEILELPRNKMPHNGMIIKNNGKYIIITRNDLNPFLKWFTVLHEIGHIKTDTIMTNPDKEHSQDIERKVNNWVLDKISSITKSDFIVNAKKVHNSESHLYRLIANELEPNIIKY